VREHNEAREIVSVPGKAQWFLHIPAIVVMLEAFDVPVVDRAVIERLFGLRRRQAIELLHRFGGFQAGRTFLIDRRVLIDHLRRLAEGEDFERETSRKERLDQAVDQIRRQRAAASVRIPVQPDVFSQKVAGLPETIVIEPGHLHIEFSGTEDLLSQLYQIAVAASNDFNFFRSATESVSQRSACRG
jgi:hypothetical protein